MNETKGIIAPKLVLTDLVFSLGMIDTELIFRIDTQHPFLSENFKGIPSHQYKLNEVPGKLRGNYSAFSELPFFDLKYQIPNLAFPINHTFINSIYGTNGGIVWYNENGECNPPLRLEDNNSGLQIAFSEKIKYLGNDMAGFYFASVDNTDKPPLVFDRFLVKAVFDKTGNNLENYNPKQK